MFVLESGKGQKSVMWKAPDISGMMLSSHLYSRYSIFLPFYLFTFLPFYLSKLSLHVGNFLLKLLYLLLLKHALILDRHHLYKLFDVAVPVVKHRPREL